MIKHIVMWNFKEQIADIDKSNLKKQMKKNLISLVGKVPGLLEVKFVEEPITSSTHDMALICTFETKKALELYGDHPAHTYVANTYVRPYVHMRSCLDYEHNI